MKTKCARKQSERYANRHDGRSRSQTGFTLAEVLVALCIIGVATVSLYAGFSTGFMLVDSAREDLRATQILTQKAEAIRLCSWSSLTNCPISFTERYDPRSSGSRAGTIFAGTVRTNVASPIPDTVAYKSNMCLAIITVSWTNTYGQQQVVHTRTLKTLIARYGMQNYVWGVSP
jgi:prepilin-type N-terminal cleavage/methylation domain-containing protein